MSRYSAGLEFVTLIDDIMFAKPWRTLVIQSVKIRFQCMYCYKRTEDALPQTWHFSIRLKGGRLVRRIIMLLIVATLMAMYGLLGRMQSKSEFDCKKVQVQFGDGFSEWSLDTRCWFRYERTPNISTSFLSAVTLLPIFSGIDEEAKGEPRQDRRPIYRDKDRRAVFRYCVDGNEGLLSFASDGYWVFYYISEDSTKIEGMCENYISRSPHTRGFNILEDSPSSWLVKRRSRDTLEYPVDYFTMNYV